MNTIEQILDLARWAPSGDNTQVWRFEIVAPDQVAVHCYDTRDHVVYDLDGHPSQVAVGAMLETMAIAASAHGLRADAVRRGDSPERGPVFDVRFTPDAAIKPSPLLAVVTTRSVQRRPLSTRPLTAQEKQALEAAAGPAHQVQWIEGFGGRWSAARLMFNNAKLRLTMPEAYEVHRSIIDWGKTHSPDKVPDQALGVDNGTLALMKWAMVSWQRVNTMNTLMGTWAPRLQMDLLPGIACAAHFVIRAKSAPAGIDDYVAAGRATQRFWLTVAALGLHMQPEMTPLIFGRYVRNAVRFTRLDPLQEAARRLYGQLTGVIGAAPETAVFMGRLGAGNAPKARSLRKPLAELMK
ncbi:molybdopterin biosynthesis protein MoeY [Massilia eburnea]|uniref:molybdopterin biosynthesis protein MoeY n=1 Tax=Massilia eburnea TaxID=1776165 RepID=UPI003D6B5116